MHTSNQTLVSLRSQLICSVNIPNYCTLLAHTPHMRTLLRPYMQDTHLAALEKKCHLRIVYMHARLRTHQHFPKECAGVISGEVACLSLGGQIHRLPPPPPPPSPPPHTHKHTCCLCVRISYLVTGADAGFRRGGGGFHMNA